MSEEVFVVPAAPVDALFPDPFTPWDFETCPARLDAMLAGGHLAPREIAEEDEAHKQVIPYVVLRVGRPDADYAYAVYERTGNEARLNGKMSVGLGGHLSYKDMPEHGTKGVWRGAWRELCEEIGVVAPHRSVEWMGWLNDRSDAVGRVHLGVVLRVTLDDWPITVTRADETRRLWFRPAPVVVDTPRGRWESWSRLLIENGAIE